MLWKLITKQYQAKELKTDWARNFVIVFAMDKGRVDYPIASRATQHWHAITTVGNGTPGGPRVSNFWSTKMRKKSDPVGSVGHFDNFWIMKVTDLMPKDLDEEVTGVHMSFYFRVTSFPFNISCEKGRLEATVGTAWRWGVASEALKISAAGTNPGICLNPLVEWILAGAELARRRGQKPWRNRRETAQGHHQRLALNKSIGNRQASHLLRTGWMIWKIFAKDDGQIFQLQALSHSHVMASVFRMWWCRCPRASSGLSRPTTWRTGICCCSMPHRRAWINFEIWTCHVFA